MGPLAGYRFLEMAGIGPGPFCALVLAELGAEIIRIDRVAGSSRTIAVDETLDLSARGRRSIALDLKQTEAVDLVLRLCAGAHGLIEGYRPGVMERLGLGPHRCLEANPRLVYGRMTGWGQDGPLAQTAGHDINYLALSGDLHWFGRRHEAPSAPLNVVADMGGGGLMLALGLTSALLEAQRSGRGQVVDAAMYEGAAFLATSIWAQRAMGWWQDERGSNLLDSGAHFYEVYTTSDGGHIAVGAIEPPFYALLLQGLGFDANQLPAQMDRASWPAMKQRFAERFASRTRADWEQVFKDSDACVTPVLTPLEATRHPHALARTAFGKHRGHAHPAGAPRFSRSRPVQAAPAPRSGEHSRDILHELGLPPDRIAVLEAAGVVRQSP